MAPWIVPRPPRCDWTIGPKATRIIFSGSEVQWIRGPTQLGSRGLHLTQLTLLTPVKTGSVLGIRWVFSAGRLGPGPSSVPKASPVEGLQGLGVQRGEARSSRSSSAGVALGVAVGCQVLPLMAGAAFFCSRRFAALRVEC